ncbi:MAG: diacylglycerol kinase family protein [Bacteroidales bacterium]
MKPVENKKPKHMPLIKGRIKSFRNAFNGISMIIKFEKNFRLQLIIFAVVITAGVIFKISTGGWIAVVIVSGLVLVSECINTAVEYMGDSVSEHYDINIKNAKDIAAAGVLISAIISVITGLIVFVPEILRYLGI